MNKVELGKEALKRIFHEVYGIDNLTDNELYNSINLLEKQVKKEVVILDANVVPINNLILFNIFKYRFGIADYSRLRSRKEVATTYFATEGIVERAEATSINKLVNIISTVRAKKYEVKKHPQMSNINVLVRK